ncbi:MAG: phosphate acyltransferase PlsX [Methylacidiphilales bacterium]|nr:phosphate acyltransferase PlsX [Candidatus Methylacidiphilales bacterium]MDW8349943.1 phosphate acyltransferase PlsX [Verrucomicrobiae bacterium]
MKIALDAMGGDFAPQHPIAGAIMALDAYDDLELILTGPEDLIQKELDRQPHHQFHRIEIVHTTQVIGMDESPIQAIRKKRDSSLTRAIELVDNGRAQAVVSAGNTGALFSAAHIKLRTLPGVDRPGLACVLPGRDKRFILIDAGANLEARPEHLFTYALMGSLYAREILGIRNPRIGLFSIGTEDIKGNELTLETHRLLKNSSLNFIGNLDGHEIFSDRCDVLIADAFVGNALLKTAESTFRAVGYWLKQSIQKKFIYKLGAFLARGAFRDLKLRADPDVFGGAILLGIDGLVLKAHGSASPLAIKNTIRLAMDFVSDHFNDHIVEEISKLKKESADNTTLEAEFKLQSE